MMMIAKREEHKFILTRQTMGGGETMAIKTTFIQLCVMKRKTFKAEIEYDLAMPRTSATHILSTKLKLG